MKRIYLYLLLLFLTLTAYAQEGPQRFNFLRNFPNVPKSSKINQRGLHLALDRATLSTLYKNEPEEFIFDLPRPNGKTKSYTLKKHQVVTSTFKVTTSDGREFTGKEYTGVSYKVFDKKGEKSFGGLTFTKDDIGGLLQENNDNINIGKLKSGKDTYVALPESEIGSSKPSFDCATPDPPLNVDETQWLKQVQPEIGNTPAPEVGQAVGGSGCKTLGIYIECDYKMYQDNGSSVANTTAKVTSLFNLVKQIYENEGISIYIDQIFVWTTQDPYASISPISSLAILNDFTTRRQNITQKLGHLLGTNFGYLGGIAWIDVVCNPAFSNYRFGYSNIYNTFNNDINLYSWSVYCMAHEIGHNFGSKHTHWCGWPKAGGGTSRIDSCYTGEAINGVGCGTTQRFIKGTIMSYCHLGNFGIDLLKGFGPLPGDKIRTGSSCLPGNAIPFIRVTTPRRFYSAGENLPLRTTTVGGATYSWTGPNGFTSNTQSSNLNTITTSSRGIYSVTATQTGCLSNAAKIRIRVNPLLNIPQTETFSTWTGANYTNWEFKGPQALSELNTNYNTGIQSFWQNSKSYLATTYNALYHTNGGNSSFLQDTAFSPVYTNNSLSSLNLNFKVAHALGLSSSSRYDSLEVLAYFSGKTSPVIIYKKGGTTLRTTTVLNTTTYKPASDISSDWRTETIDLSSYDTCKNVQFAFVFKPTQLTTRPSNNIFVSTINVNGTDSPTALKTPTISVDSVNNLDKNYTLTTTIPSTHNATSYQVMQGATVIASGNLGNNNSTTITTARINVTNGTYTHTSRLSNGTQTTISSPVTVNVNFNVAPILTGTMSVDSTTNRDQNYNLSFSIPQNHNATSYQILQGTTVIGSGNLANNNSTTITLSRTGISNGTYTHTAKLFNSSKTPNNTTSNSVTVVVNYNPVINLGTPTVTADSLINLDKDYLITFTVPSNHNATSYEIKEGNTIVKSSSLLNNNSFTTTHPVANKPNGTYTYTGVLKNGIYNSISIPINVIVNYNPSVPTSSCTTNTLTSSDRRRTSFTYSFTLDNSCPSTGYKVLFYNGNSANGFLANDSTLSQTQVSRLAWQPTGGSVRNAGQSNGNISFTTSERQLGIFSRVANPLPSYGNRWYRVDVVCTSCTQTVKTKTAYFFVK